MRRASRAAIPGFCTGPTPIFCRTRNGQVLPTHSISAGLDYPAVGPEHAELRRLGRARYAQASDKDALAAAHELCRLEGILPALESAHAIAYPDQGQAAVPERTISSWSICPDAATRTWGLYVREPWRGRFTGDAPSGRAGFVPFLVAGDPFVRGEPARGDAP